VGILTSGGVTPVEVKVPALSLQKTEGQGRGTRDFSKNLATSTHQDHLRTMADKVNLASKFSKIHEYWKPYIAAELNGQYVKLDKLKGEFIFHHHENEDEMFLVVKGRFRMEFRDRQVWLEEGEFIVVPRGSSIVRWPNKNAGFCCLSRPAH
jgi:mannose-6-phosphate isomerase-like protein (cupin superfamily)